MKNICKLIVFITLTCPVCLAAQPVGNIRGVITDGASGQPLPYVTIVVLRTNPTIGATTDSMGRFRLNSLPVGRYDIQSSFIGYEPAVFKEIMVASGKEVVLDISMRENVNELGEVVIRAKVNKEATLNTMALAGGRMLSVEEANRYAGGFDDPARLVTAFAGVSGSTNGNSIVVRGNSPQFLQWKVEGVEAVNPTHFSDITSGVGGGILTGFSSQTLGNSDFFTSAFPAEYGNALSGVFDMQLRNGNNQTYEHTAQLSTLGIEFASEGPLAKGSQASYLFNYRYSSLALVADALPNLAGDAGGMRYQDLSFKMNFPTKRAGTFSVWGIGLKDHFIQNADEDTTQWEDIYGNGHNVKQTKAVGGIGHKIFISEKSFLKSALAANYMQNDLTADLIAADLSKSPAADMKNTNWNLTFESYLNTKFSAMHTNRTGINATSLFYDLDYWIQANGLYGSDFGNELINFAKSSGGSMAFSAFSQSSFRLDNALTANVGLHATYFHLNGKATIEPRASVRWQSSPKHAFSLAYGKHSRRENTDYYFVKTDATGDELVNEKLDFAKAHHIVMSYDWSISEHLRLKVEPYFQYLYDVPVEKDGVISLINHRDFWLMTPLVNDGKGKNYGVDMTLERYLHEGYYYMLTASLFESRYMGGDGVWRNTRLNRNYIINALGGKEWKMGKQKQNILSVSLRFTLQGGERYTPADEAASIAAQTVILNNTQAYQSQLSPQFISHFTIGYKVNRKKWVHDFSVKMLNVTQCWEFVGYGYNHRLNRPEMYKSSIAMPSISYKIEF